MRGVSVYIEGVKLDLFDDEQINVTSIQQNVQDIAAVFTDFSQSFTVPATPNNNQVFEHFYQNDVNASIDFNLRREALIEIDLTTFRRGKISLEKTEVRNNEPYSYQITFYGDVASLKDTFGESKLVDITALSSTDMSYTFAQVSQRITDDATEHTIRFPLIVGRNLTYGDTGSTDINPSTGSGSILYNELFPALAVFQIFNALQTQYGITFNGGFLNNERFRRAYLYCQNAETFTFNSKPLLIDISTLSTNPLNNNNSLAAADYFSIDNDTLTLSQYVPSVTFPTVTSAGGNYINSKHIINISLNNPTAGVDAFIDVYENGSLTQTYDVSSSTSLQIQRSNDVLITPIELKFFIRSTAPMTGTMLIEYKQSATYFYSGGADLVSNEFTATASVTTTATLSVLNYLPDMKIVDFFKGILQMFNLTCYGTAKDVYQIEPLDDWYKKGAIVDITEYTDIKSTKIDRIKLFKNISFSYQESECATNEAFRDITGGRDYGNTSQLYDYDGGEYKIDLPFENMMMQKFENTDLQIGERLNTDIQTYIPKPMIMYAYDTTSAQWRFNDGSSVTDMTTYIPFGQDLRLGTSDFTLNFNADISTFLLEPIPNTLFSVYYAPYLTNLYNLKNRRTNVKTNLPISLLTGLQLNDRVIIRDKRYMIESMKSNLNTGDVDLVLINDFRELIADGGIIPEVIVPDNSAQCLNIDILFPNGVVSATITTTTAGVTISPSTITQERRVEVCLPVNTATDLIVTEDGTDNITDENAGSIATRQLRTEGGSATVIILLVTYTFSNGTTAANQIFIQQEG
tara:strand:+ start:2877 stop:5282 length:2406 start_codon:yes stop_codon:yes gene_type:complete